MSKLQKISLYLLSITLIFAILVSWNSIEDYFILSKRFEKPENRSEAWNQDLEYLQNDYLKICRSFNKKQKKKFILEIEGIKIRRDQLSDNEIALKITHAVALANDAHSNVKLKYMPIVGVIPSWFKEGLFITKTSTLKRHHLGKRIVKINDLQINEVKNKFYSYIPGIDANKKSALPYLIIRPDFWNGLYRKYSSKYVTVEMINESGNIETDTIFIEPIRSTLINLYWKNVPDSIFVKHPKPFKTLPLYLSSPYKAAFYKELNNNLIYIQLNSSKNKGIDLGEFSKDLKYRLERNNFENIILDIRLNSGGNYNLTRKIEKCVLKSIKRNGGHLYLITGNRTASAAINLAAALKAKLKGKITILGEPIGDSLTFWAEPKIFTLPNSGLKISASTYHHNMKTGKFTPFKTYLKNLFRNFNSNGLDVDTLVEVSINDYIAHRDPVLEAIKKKINKKSNK